MKICWIGTSYMSMGEAVSDEDIPIDFVNYIAQRHPSHEHLNLSIPGMGFNYTPNRIEYALQKGYTHFIMELPNGLRQNFISSVHKEKPHGLYLKIQEYKNGKQVYVKDQKPQLYLDTWLSRCDNRKLKDIFLETDFPFMHDDNFWDMLKKLSVMIDERFKRCEWIHSALNIQTRLESEGKKVLFYEWDMCSTSKKGTTQDNIHGKQVFTQCCKSSDSVYRRLNMMSDPWPLTIKWAIQDGYLAQQRVNELIKPGLDEESREEIEYSKEYKRWQENNYYDGSHLNDEALRKYSSTFDQVIWDWENGK